jgi:hypothetical protein
VTTEQPNDGARVEAIIALLTAVRVHPIGG